jgi:microcystin-dependent protein
MADPFIAEVRIVPFNFAPRGWAFCDGQILPIAQNTALFSLLGTTYGGNGTSNFALPNLQGRAPSHPGQGPGLPPRTLGEQTGTESVVLLASEMPAHTHSAGVTTAPASRANPVGGRFGTTIDATYAAGASSATGGLHGPAGSSQPHDNMQPSLVLNFIIALQGIFPPRP